MTTAVAVSVLAFTGWLVGLLASVLVASSDFAARHPRLAARLDRTVWVSWIGSTIVLFGPALGLLLAAMFTS
jgi:hypothetical protein